MVLFTLVQNPGNKPQFKDAGHYRTFIKGIPIEAHKAAGKLTNSMWANYIQLIRSQSQIPRERNYEPFQRMNLIASINALRETRFNNPLSEASPASIIITELIELNQQAIRQTEDKGLIRLYMANIKAFEKLGEMTSNSNADILEEVQNVLQCAFYALNVSNPPQLVDVSIQANNPPQLVDVSIQANIEQTQENNTISSNSQDIESINMESNALWPSKDGKIFKRLRSLAVVTASSNTGTNEIESQLANMTFNKNDSFTDIEGISHTMIDDKDMNIPVDDISSQTTSDQSHIMLLAKRHSNIDDTEWDKMSAAMRKKIKNKYKKSIVKDGVLVGKSIVDVPIINH